MTMIRRWMILLLCLVSFTLGLPTPAAANNSPKAVAAETTFDTAATATAIFAGGCFWCMEKPFDELPGVISTTSGYTGGTVEAPTYKQVSAGGTGHFEAVKITYNPNQISYEKLLNVFWQNIDPVDERGQFCDHGSQYRSAIFYQNDAQQAIAYQSKTDLANSNQFAQNVATVIQPATTFYPAEDYHQNYYKTHPVRYKVYRFACGRDQRLAEIWGSDAH